MKKYWNIIILLFLVLLLYIKGSTILDIDDTSISSGVEHSCAIYLFISTDIGGPVLCWGENHKGQTISPKGEFIQVSCGHFHTCGIRLDGTVVCWGDLFSPTGIFDQISSGDFHTCGILNDASIKCWGRDFHDQVSEVPDGRYIQVSSGKSHACAISFNGFIKCWGHNNQGQINGPLETKFIQISASPGDFTCGITESHEIQCWGDNSRKQCNPPKIDEDTNLKIKYSSVSTSRLAACGIMENKKIICWGMRDGIFSYPKDLQFDEISLGWDHGCGAIAANGKIICWGESYNGRITPPKELSFIR